MHQEHFHFWKECAQYVLHKQHKLTARKYASLIGTLNSVRGAVTSAPLHIWPLLHLQRSVLARVKDLDRQVHVTPRVIQELEWWQSELQHWNGKSVILQKHHHIRTTDASGLGFFFGGGGWHKVGSRHRKEDEARGFCSRREGKNSSNW